MIYRKSTEEKPNPKYTFISRHDRLKLACITVLWICFAISACDFREVDAQTDTDSKKENNMESIQSASTIQQNIPPIDAVSTPEIETATFALG
jgi:hypothetical protein